jgi:hypothetical protein
LATPFTLKEIAHIQQAFNLKCRYSRLRAKGRLTAKAMSVRHGVTTPAINLWAREGRLQKHRYDNVRRCLYEPLEKGNCQRSWRATGQAANFHRCTGGMRCSMKRKLVP